MENKSPFYPFKWPTPDAFEIALVLGMAFTALIIFIIYKYLESKEQDRIHNYQHFLFQAKHKGLNNFQFKILKNMAAYLKLAHPSDLVINSSLFESTLSDFIEYLKKQTEGEDNLREIFRDLTIIYERLYISGSLKKPLESMADIEDGEILYFTTDSGEVYLGKAAGRGSNFIELLLFTPAKNLRIFENESAISLHVLRVNDAEYLIRTVSMGIDGNIVKVKLSDDLSREREFRHPYINVVIPAIVTVEPLSAAGEPEKVECSILKINEYECVTRIPVPLEYGREYHISFEISKFKFNVNSRIVSSKTVETESVYYLTFKFLDMTEPGKVILTRYIAESL